LVHIRRFICDCGLLSSWGAATTTSLLLITIYRGFHRMAVASRSALCPPPLRGGAGGAGQGRQRRTRRRQVADRDQKVVIFSRQLTGEVFTLPNRFKTNKFFLSHFVLSLHFSPVLKNFILLFFISPLKIHFDSNISTTKFIIRPNAMFSRFCVESMFIVVCTTRLRLSHGFCLRVIDSVL